MGRPRFEITPEILQKTERLAAQGIGTITNALFDSAVKGSVPAQIFYLKNRDQDNWSDIQAHNVSVVAKLSDSQLLEEVKSDPKLIEALETSVVGSKSLESIKEL